MIFAETTQTWFFTMGKSIYCIINYNVNFLKVMKLFEKYKTVNKHTGLQYKIKYCSILFSYLLNNFLSHLLFLSMFCL
ncbi:hypothetical protein EDEG_01163 [Edhazardia aedis USNM 41457]|uniref:Uncharacterized protein n=1 Tax=Edhazardia aedis (strain USNM 41457) TaxID=1003232 RepID=J9DA81_EDHAE|nr:hypothetical protein EDEG_01163 [Edhazardia aedis USNM 41457]|eukprot:EJW04636.1 hypothetical protein EDEG_01163 [Edhazardia aedis USNM 41457]